MARKKIHTKKRRLVNKLKRRKGIKTPEAIATVVFERKSFFKK